MIEQVAPHRQLCRDARHRVLGGVASGLAEHLGVPVLTVRVIFVVLTATAGAGLLAYAALWAFVPARAAAGEPQRQRDDVEWPVLALLAVGTGVLILLNSGGLLPGSGAALPLFAVLGGALLVWRQADEAQRARWRVSTSGRRGAVLRLGGGTLLVVAGLGGFLAQRGQLGAAKTGLLSTLIVVAGLGLLSGPWWLRMTAELRSERRERIRSEERAEVAAHVHDSVLQTLTLIQKSAQDPAEVRRLARSQERELRDWLYAPKGHRSSTLVGALERLAAEVEESHGVPIEVVGVGDCPEDPRLDALCAAAREAMVNASQHSGAFTVSVYVEVEAASVTVFIRDRGRGFDAAHVLPDRFGVSESIIGRMERNGGVATIRSGQAAGTEVRLEMARG